MSQLNFCDESAALIPPGVLGSDVNRRDWEGR